MGEESDASRIVNELVDEYRARCLWFLRADYYPRSTAERIRVLGYIERHGDREAYRKAATVRRWLSHPSSDVDLFHDAFSLRPEGPSGSPAGRPVNGQETGDSAPACRGGRSGECSRRWNRGSARLGSEQAPDFRP
jgi:hypothetical protein